MGELIDLIKETIATSKERIKSPIIGSYTLAFFIWNWRAISILLFSESSIENKIEFINENYCSWWGIGGPLIISFFYVGLIPYIMMSLDLVIEYPVNYRRIKLNKTNILEIKHQLELEDTKARKKEVETYNQKIDSLEYQLKTFEEQHINEVEGYKKIIEKYKQIADNNQKSIKSIDSLLRASRSKNIFMETLKDENDLEIFDMDFNVDFLTEDIRNDLFPRFVKRFKDPDYHKINQFTKSLVNGYKDKKYIKYESRQVEGNEFYSFKITYEGRKFLLSYDYYL